MIEKVSPPQLAEFHFYDNADSRALTEGGTGRTGQSSVVIAYGLDSELCDYRCLSEV